MLCLAVGELSNREQGTKRAAEWVDVQVARIKIQAHGVQEHYEGSSRALWRFSTSCTDGTCGHKKGRLQQGQTVRGCPCRRCNQVSRRLRQLQLVTKWIFVASVPLRKLINRRSNVASSEELVKAGGFNGLA